MTTFVFAGDAAFPPGLRTLPRPPAGLWVAGQLPAPGTPSLAIVGSRAASVAGCERARAWAAGAAARGVAVISGGALGIDAAAHDGALSRGGRTFAVLGCGVDVIYPDRHGPLFQRIAASGALLSEYPLGTPPRAGQFPVRNRLIVALADAVVVVEAKVRSGALVTARLAHQMGRRLLAVPGTSGTDLLIQKGMAWPVTTEAELADALEGRRSCVPAGPAVPPSVAPLIDAIGKGLHAPAALALYLGRPLSEIMAALMEAEIDGWLRKSAGSHYEVTNGH